MTITTEHASADVEGLGRRARCCSSAPARARGSSPPTPTGRRWSTDGPMFLGHIVNHLVLDPRDGRTLLAGLSTGHLGPTVFRSTDLGADLAGGEPPARVRRR